MAGQGGVLMLSHSTYVYVEDSASVQRTNTLTVLYHSSSRSLSTGGTSNHLTAVTVNQSSHMIRKHIFTSNHLTS